MGCGAGAGPGRRSLRPPGPGAAGERVRARAFYIDMYAGGEATPNFARYTFLDPSAPSFFADWEQAADMPVAIVRTEAGRNPRQSSARSGRGAVDPQRLLPHPLGKPRRPSPWHRHEAVPSLLGDQAGLSPANDAPRARPKIHGEALRRFASASPLQRQIRSPPRRPTQLPHHIREARLATDAGYVPWPASQQPDPARTTPSSGGDPEPQPCRSGWGQ